MKQQPSYPLHRTKVSLVACLAALATVSATSAWAQSTTTTTNTSTSTESDEVQTLSPFEVTSEKDVGYLRTNSVTASRISMPIQNIPISVSVMAKDFIDDNNIRSITDIFRYSSSGAGDNRFAMARPANSATPQGGFTLRGFGVNSLLRNGVSRYNAWNINNIDRVEVVKGPASVFFGSGYPGGVVNYITKQPVFGKIPTTITHQFGENNINRAVLDHNAQLSRKAAMRVVASWENSSGERNFEYKKENSFTANLTLLPFDSGKLKITAEVETIDQKYNMNQADWYFPAGWFKAYANPGTDIINAAGTAVSGAADPVAAYRARIFSNGAGTWANDVRNATGNYTMPTYTNVIRGAYYQDASGNYIHDTGFNYTNRGSYTNNHNDTSTLTVEMYPVSFVDLRYVLTNENGRFDNVEGFQLPNADARTFNTQYGLNGSGYWRRIQNHQVDAIFKYDKWGIKNRLLVGGVFIKQLQQYNAPITKGNTFLNPFYSLVPGSTNPQGNANGTLVPADYQPPANEVPVNQVIRDRFGKILTVAQVFQQWDPGAEIQPDNHRLVEIDRAAIDGYYTQDQAGYINYQGSLLDDRLTILAGVRREMHRDSGQYLTANFPWFANPPYAFANQQQYPPSAYNYDVGYAGDSNNFQRQAGTSWMAGVSFQVVKDVNVFASYSKVFRLNNGVAGGLSKLSLPDWYNAAKQWAQTQTDPATGQPNPYYNSAGNFTYRGKTITSQADLEAALSEIGAFDIIKPETGFNAEVGVKTSLWDNKLVGTASIFRAERKDQKFDDGGAQAAEPLNGGYTNGGNYAIFGPTTNRLNNFAGARLLRWRTTSIKNRIEGADFEVTWTPIRNFQAVVNGAWLWTAKTLDYINVAKPGTAAYNSSTPAAKVNSDIYYGARLENVPEYRLNAFANYTFTDGPLAGFSVGGAMRYSSETVVSRSVDWNPLSNGFQSGDFVTFDANIGYQWELFGYKIGSRLAVYNVTDEKYVEGPTYVLSPARYWLVTNTLKF